MEFEHPCPMNATHHITRNIVSFDYSQVKNITIDTASPI